MASIILLGALASLPAPLRAQERGQDSSALNDIADLISVNGFVSTTYSHNFNRPSTGTNGYRVFDFDDGDFKIDVAEIVLQKPVAEPDDAGFRIDVALGGSIPRISASRGLFRGADGIAQDIDLQQAFVSYVAPIGKGLRIDLGKFITPHGYEVIEGYDGYNDNATRSFMFGYAIPFTHTGLRLSYAASPALTATLMALNGWDVVKDNNRAKTACAQLLIAPADGLSLSLAYIAGAERDSNDTDLRQVIDLVAIWKIGDQFSLGINGDYGVEKNAVAPDATAAWQGIAGYAKLAITQPFTIALRAEYFNDRDGARTGIPQALKEITLTPEYHPTPNIAFRADLRMDISSQQVFDKDGAASDTQPTVLVNGIYSF